MAKKTAQYVPQQNQALRPMAIERSHCCVSCMHIKLISGPDKRQQTRLHNHPKPRRRTTISASADLPRGGRCGLGGADLDGHLSIFLKYGPAPSTSPKLNPNFDPSNISNPLEIDCIAFLSYSQPEMSCLLPIGEVVPLQRTIERGSVVVFQSTFWDPDGAGTSDKTSVNLVDRGDLLLHISIRNGQDAICFNSRKVGGRWGAEERERLRGSFVRPNISITVYDHGDRYEILFSGKTVHFYRKRINRNPTSVAYWIDQRTSPFSNPLVVSMYTSTSEIFASSSPAHSEIRPVSPLDMSV